MVNTPQDPANLTSVGEVVADTNNSLSALLSYARSLARVDSLLAAFTNSELSAQFQVAAMRQDRLVLLTPTASWATRLRMQSGQMLQFLQASGYQHLRFIDIRVAPLSRELVKNPVRRHLSPAAELAFGLMSRLSDDSENSGGKP